MPIRAIMLTALVTASVFFPAVQALEVDREVLPRVTLGGRVIATADRVDEDSSPSAEDGVNVEDSIFLLRFDKRLYARGVAGAVMGLEEIDDEIRFHQLHAFYWNQDFKLVLGRTRLRNTLIEFGTLRDDDLLELTHVANASSNADFDQRYGEIADVEWYPGRGVQTLGFWAGTRRNDVAATPDGFDSLGFAYRVDASEDLIYLKRVRHAGVVFDRQKVAVGADERWMHAWIVGLDMNVNLDPESSWSAAFQAIAVEGDGGAPALGTLAGRAAAQSRAWVAGVRYTARPNLLTRWQAAVTLGYKEFPDVADAEQWTVTPSFAYLLGQGADLVVQAGYTDYGGSLFGGGADTRLQIGLVFSLDARYNDTIGERTSILNLEHGYIE